MLPSFNSNAQGIHFNNTSLADALLFVSREFDIKVAFDSKKLKKISINKTINKSLPEDIIEQLLDGTDYRYEKKHERFLILAKRTQNAKFKNPTIYSGVVIDKHSLEKLPHATLYIPSINSSQSTTVDGYFSIQIPDAGLYKVKISYLGYYPMDTTILFQNDSGLNIFALEHKLQTIKTIDVKADKLKLIDFNKKAGQFSFNPTKFIDLPSFGEVDVFRSLQLLPGINNSENSSQLNIRGGSADQNLVLFDGFTLYSLDHFLGIFSALNPYVIKNIQVYKGGFNSRYGERISGIVDITGKTGNRQKTQVYGGVNLINANLTIEVPVSNKLTIIAAGRRAYSDMYSTSLADELIKNKFGQRRRFPTNDVSVIEPEFYFSDFNFKTTFNPNPGENLSLSLYGGKDYLQSTVETNREGYTINTDDENKWGNNGIGFAWNKQREHSHFSSLKIGFSSYFNDYNNITDLDGDLRDIPNSADKLRLSSTIEVNELIDYFISWQSSFLLNKSNQFEAGASVKLNKFSFFKEAENNFIYDNINKSAMIYALYFQDKITLGKKWVLEPGLRSSYYGKTAKPYLEPRFSANYSINENLFLKLTTGKYYQFLHKANTAESYGYNRDFWILSDGIDHPVLSANHFITGVGLQSNKIYFDLEVYYKSVNGLQEYLFFNKSIEIPEIGDNQDNTLGNNSPDDFRQFIQGKGQSYGLDLLIKYETPNAVSLLSYSYGKSTQNYSKINNKLNIPAPSDQTHQIKWTNLYSYKKWNFSTFAVYSTGKPYVEDSEMDEDFNVSRVYNRLPDYFRVDFSTNYNFNIGNVYVKPGLSIINILNTENYFDEYTRRFDLTNNSFNEITFVKSPDLSLNFFINFRF